MTDAEHKHMTLMHAGELVDMAGAMLKDVGEAELFKESDILRRRIGDKRHAEFIKTLGEVRVP